MPQITSLEDHIQEASINLPYLKDFALYQIYQNQVVLEAQPQNINPEVINNTIDRFAGILYVLSSYSEEHVSDGVFLSDLLKRRQERLSKRGDEPTLKKELLDVTETLKFVEAQVVQNERHPRVTESEIVIQRTHEKDINFQSISDLTEFFALQNVQNDKVDLAQQFQSFHSILGKYLDKHLTLTEASILLKRENVTREQRTDMKALLTFIEACQESPQLLSGVHFKEWQGEKVVQEGLKKWNVAGNFGKTWEQWQEIHSSKPEEENKKKFLEKYLFEHSKLLLQKYLPNQVPSEKTHLLFTPREGGTFLGTYNGVFIINLEYSPRFIKSFSTFDPIASPEYVQSLIVTAHELQHQLQEEQLGNIGLIASIKEGEIPLEELTYKEYKILDELSLHPRKRGVSLGHAIVEGFATGVELSLANALLREELSIVPARFKRAIMEYKKDRMNFIRGAYRFAPKGKFESNQTPVNLYHLMKCHYAEGLLYIMRPLYKRFGKESFGLIKDIDIKTCYNTPVDSKAYVDALHSLSNLPMLSKKAA